MVKQKFLLALSGAIWMCFSLMAQAFPFGDDKNPPAFTAETNTSEVELGESFRLTVVMDGQTLSGTPDFTGLKQDFDILSGPNQQRIYQSTNGNTISKTIWQLTLQPKSVGALVIPPIQFKNAKTDPIVINVKAATTSAPSDPIFYEATVDRDEVYVQAQLILTLRLYIEVNLLDNKFGEVNIPDAILKQLDDPRAFSVQRGTRHYNVVEVKFAVFPQKSGELKIPSMAFEAIVEIPGTQDQFLMFGGPDTKRVVLRSQELTVKVRPKPQNYPDNAQWLPAKQVELKENWTGNPNKVKVGEPITRTITLSAIGQLSSALPRFEIENAKGYKIYPDKPQSTDANTSQGVTGSQKEALAIVPNAGGAITLPATKLYWWNTETDKLEVAELHSKTLMVEGGAPVASPATVTPPPSPAELEQAAPTPAPASPELATLGSAEVKRWQAAAAVLGLLWLATLALYFLRARKPAPQANSSVEQDAAANVQKQIVTVKHLREQAIAACHHHQALTARDAIIKYFAALLPGKQIHSLGDIKRQVADAGVVSCIDELEKILYKDTDESWDGTSLANALSQLKLTKVNKSLPAPLLQALYPSH